MDKEKLVLAVDLGTTNIKSGIINKKGKILSLIQKELPLEKDNTGKAEHAPEVIFNIFAETIRETTKGYEDKIGILITSSYMFGVLPLDKNMKPLTGIITLLDTRTKEIFNELLKEVDFKEVYKRTGCPPLLYYPFVRIYWLKKKHKEIFDSAKFYLGSKSFLIYKLMGELYTEPSIDSSTQLLNIHTLNWDPYVLDFLGISYENLPQVVSADKILGKLPKSTLNLLGLKGEVLLGVGLYDGGAVGSGIGALGGDGIGVINIGTTAMFRVPYPKVVFDDPQKMRIQVPYFFDGKWFPGGGINNAGIILKWYRDNLFNLSYEEQSKIAKDIESDNLFFLPYLTGERNPDIGSIASGVLFGLRPHHTKAHIVRAGMEGVSYIIRMLYETLRELGIEVKEVRAGGGGTKSDTWMQILADIMGLEVAVTRVEEPALLGSAVLGFTMLGEFSSYKEATEKLVKIEKVYSPNKEKKEYYNKKFEFFVQLTHNLKEAFSMHNQL
ncbi:MAG: gluconokinase [Dictyoglomus turgidum]|uniref:gluconokinase n=1 Tax=Dictyoglomus turgidum TaxID=513050 RepID=UPI003C762BC1